MTTSKQQDTLRQIANVLGAIFQVAAAALGFAFGMDVGAVSDQNRTLIVPAGSAFIIWSPIFLLAFVYAAYQALPAQRDNPLLRRVGWFTAAAFAGNGVWEILFPNQLFVLAEILIIAIGICIGTAFFRMVTQAREQSLSTVETLTVALPIGLMFGWLTAANIVGFAATLVTLGVAATGPAAAVGSAALLVAGGAIAGVVLLIGKSGPVVGWAAYVFSVLWALVWIAVEHQADAPLVAGTAVVIALILLALSIFGRTLVVSASRNPGRTGSVTATVR